MTVCKEILMGQKKINSMAGHLDSSWTAAAQHS
jgi:hypothetical protein